MIPSQSVVPQMSIVPRLRTALELTCGLVFVKHQEETLGSTQIYAAVMIILPDFFLKKLFILK